MIKAARIATFLGILTLRAQDLPDPDAKAVHRNPAYSSAIAAGRSAVGELASRQEQLPADKGYKRALYLPRVAKAALEAGDNETAQALANEGLAFLTRNKFFAEHAGGETIYYGNFVLGRLALLDGDVRAAKEYLLKAGLTDGSPVLDSFGPNMSLARELLKAHEEEAVLKFLEKCKTFWHCQDSLDRLTHWQDDITHGRMPDFGHMLFE